MSYTSLLPVDAVSAVVTYDLRLPVYGKLSTVQFTFAMRVQVLPAPVVGKSNLG
jgi:hypothetical protein